MFQYEEEKLSALKMYMLQRELDLNDEMLKAIDGLYTKFVPANVREFIDLREKTKPIPKPRKNKEERDEIP